TQELGLLLLPLAHGIHADFTEDKGTVPHSVEQAEQIAPERLRIMQIDIKGGKVQEGEIQILGRRIVRVGQKCIGIYLPGDIGQFPQEPLDTCSAVPPDNIGRYLVPDAERKERRMVAQASRCRANMLSRLPLRLDVVQEAE